MSRIVQDERHLYRLHEGRVAEWIATNGLGDVDLVFVDDSKTGVERMATIEAIAATGVKAPVVIHDFQYHGYRRVAKKCFDREWMYTPPGKLPATGLVWASGVLKDQQVSEIQEYIENLAVVCS